MKALKLERDELELRVNERTERLNRLNAELHHRLRNLLSVVSAMARQSGADPRFSEVFDKRLRGLAATLELLTDTQWQGARIRDVLKAQLGVFESGLEVSVTGPYFMLNEGGAASGHGAARARYQCVEAQSWGNSFNFLAGSRP